METFNDFDPDLDGTPSVAVPKSDLPTVAPESKPLSSEVGGKKSTKSKKRNQRKRAAAKTKKKEEAATLVPESESDSSARSHVELETSMALVKIGPSSAARSTEIPTRPKVKFVPQPMDKKWMGGSSLLERRRLYRILWPAPRSNASRAYSQAGESCFWFSDLIKVLTLQGTDGHVSGPSTSHTCCRIK